MLFYGVYAIEDASGRQEFSYGRMGEVVKNIRTFALPNEQNTYTFTMKFEYDSWNRILGTTYPDGEHVRYWKGYTKHYYAGSERVIGVLFDAHEFRLDKLYFYKNAESGTMDRYFYHPDHLGSSSWITDNTGRPIQHLHYLPFGEDWVDQRNTSWNAPYTFSGKEKDVETGYGYFGARYYDSGLSIWLSVDPMSDKYPSMSPYNYCANNPVMLVDPDGREIYPTVNFMKSNYWTAHKYLLNNNQNYSNALDLFITSNNYNIYYSTAEMYGKGGNTSYEYYTNNGRTTHIESDESYNNADASSPLSIFHFYILIHEKGHTLESFVKNDVTKRNYGHDGFVMQLNLIMGMFNELNEDLKLNLSKSQIFELSIYGAESTDVYKNYIKELANSNKTDFETENANYVNRMHDLMSKEVKID